MSLLERIVIAMFFLLALASGYRLGLTQRPDFPCDEERRIAWNDGYTLGYADAAEHRSKAPLEKP